MIGTSRRPTATVTNTISPVTASSRAVGQQFGTEPDLASCGGLLKSTMCSGLASRAFDLVNPTLGQCVRGDRTGACPRSAHSCRTPGACRSRLITAAPGGAGGGGANLTPFGTELLEGTSVSRNRRGCGVDGGGVTLELALDQFARGYRPRRGRCKKQSPFRIRPPVRPGDLPPHYVMQ